MSDPFTEIPADMLLFQICIPFALQHFKLRTTIKTLLKYWFTAVGWALGLTEFLLPRPDDNGGHENGNVDFGRQDGVNAEHHPGFAQHDAAPALIEEADGPHDLAANDGAMENDNGEEQSDSELVIDFLEVLTLSS